MKFAVIETGGKQYRVAPGLRLKVEKLTVAKDGAVVFDKVLLLSDDKTLKIGVPYVPAAKVEAKLVADGRGERKIVFRYHSKTRYRKLKTHRQPFTEVEIGKI
jgi:large subunit ribosomal protein L21